MKRNHWFLLAVLGASTFGATLTSQTAFAEKKGGHKGGFSGQERRGPNGRGRGRMMEKMAQELNLSTAQKTKLQAIMKDSRDKSQKIRENKSLSEDQKRAKLRENREATKKRMDTVLTSTQKKKLAEMRKEMRERMRERRGKDGKGGFSGQRKPI